MLFPLLKPFYLTRYDPVILFNKIGLATWSHETPIFNKKAEKYLNKNGVMSLFQQYGDLSELRKYNLFLSGHKKYDIYNLHKDIILKKRRSVVEFGSGVSTIAMAHAAKLNRERGIKNSKIYAVESDERWAKIVENALEKLNLSDYAEVSYSPTELKVHDYQVYSEFKKLPNVRPDMIYLDGPDPKSVTGSVKGLTMEGLEFIIAVDPLFYEWSFYATASIIVDGRINNVKFLQKNLKRTYRVKRNYFRNITEFILIS